MARPSRERQWATADLWFSGNMSEDTEENEEKFLNVLFQIITVPRIYCGFFIDPFQLAARQRKVKEKEQLYGRESDHKSRAAGGNATLGNCMQREQHHQGDIGDLQQGLGEVSSCGLCRAKGDPSASVPTFCLHRYFVDTNKFC